VSSRRLCGTLSPLGAPAARCTRRQACLASCAHRSVRRHAIDALAASGLLACRRPRCCTRGHGRTHRAPAPRAPVRYATGRACAGRRGRRLLRAGRTAARRALSGWAGWARARRRRRRMHVAAVDGRQRRAIGCAPLALLNYAAARAPRDAWVAVAKARRAGRRGRRLAAALRACREETSCLFRQRRRRRRRRWWWRRGNGGGQDARNDGFRARRLQSRRARVCAAESGRAEPRARSRVATCGYAATADS